MNTYVDYEYYSKEYMQGANPNVDATSFLFLLRKAENYLDFNTNGQYLLVSDEEEIVKVKDCLCALVDSFNEESKGADSNGAFKQSESVGGHSVSYAYKTTHSYDNDRFSIMKSYLWKLGILGSRKVYGLNES